MKKKAAIFSSQANPVIFFAKAQGACKRGTAAMLCIVLALATTSCVKQRNCDCGETGKFVYLKEPYKGSSTACRKTGKVVAHFILDNGFIKPITDYVPKEFRSYDTLRVNACTKWACEGRVVPAIFGPEIYSLKCIERE